MKKISSFILFVLLGLGVFAQFPKLPHGKVTVDSFKSEVLGVNRQYSVYLPKSFETSSSKKYPILYLLHSVFDNNNDWIMRGHMQDVVNKLIDAGEAQEMVIIVPDAGREWNGYFDMDGWSYETFFFTEFMPYIESKYRFLQGNA